MNLPNTVTFSCPQCVAKFIYNNFAREEWPKRAQQANAGQQHSIYADVMEELKKRGQE